MSLLNDWFTKVNIPVLVYGSVAIWGIYMAIKYGTWARRKTDDGPIVASAGMLTSGSLTSLHKGVIEGYVYNLIVGSNAKIFVYVQLRANTKIHIVALGDKSGLKNVELKSQLGDNLTKVDLEGNFPDYFEMYCSPIAEIELLQLFDPEDMAYFVDFCRAYDFELYKDTIYISQAANAHDEKDNTTLISDIEAVLKNNKKLFDKLQSRGRVAG